MAYVRVEQRNARLAAGVRLDTVQGKDGPLVKGTAVAISNVRKGSGEGREDAATSIQWTFWGKLAETAAEYLGKGSRVNIVGRVQNNNYKNAEDEPVYGLTFTCEEIDFLDSRAEVEARRAWYEAGEAPRETTAKTAGKGNTRARPPAKSNHGSNVRSHLRIASAVLAEVRPPRQAREANRTRALNDNHRAGTP